MGALFAALCCSARKELLPIFSLAQDLLEEACSSLLISCVSGFPQELHTMVFSTDFYLV